MENKRIDFIARHYRKGRFEASAGWRRLAIGASSRRRRYGIAAALAGLLILSASAGLLVHRYYSAQIQEPPEEFVEASPMLTVKVIDFDNAPLESVVETIESVYGVSVVGLPEHPEDYSLSLHYEGTPTELIAVINEILGTRMEVVEK